MELPRQSARPERASSYVDVLRDVSYVLTSEHDWRECVGYALDHLTELLPYDVAAVLAPHAHQWHLLYLGSSVTADMADRMKRDTVEHYDRLTGNHLAADAVVITPLEPIRAAGNPVASRPEDSEARPPASSLSLPLVGLDEVEGIILVVSRRPDAYDVDELARFSLVAALIGGYLTHTRQASLLRQANQDRDDFIAELAHEVKNPLTTTYLAIQRLQRRFNATESAGDRRPDRDLIVVAERELRRAIDTLETSLDPARFESGRGLQEFAVVDLTSLIPPIVEAARVTTDGHTIALSQDDGLVVWGHSDSIGQVLRNLLSNAIKYSPAGGAIEVKATVDGPRQWVTISVKDPGIGLTIEQQEQVLTRYYRADTATSRRLGKFGGMGLGLYVSNEIVRRHGGTIWVESQPGQGTTFFVRLPTSGRPSP